MSALLSSSTMGYHGLIMTAEEYARLGETQARYELVNGVVMMSPSPTPLHWLIIQEVLLQLQTFAASRGGLETYAETDLFVDRHTVYRPDLLIYNRPRGRPTNIRLTTPPAVILEVLSPDSKPLDLITKRDAYERFGVREYWVIDPDNGQLKVWRAAAERYAVVSVGPAGYASQAIGGFTLNLAALASLCQTS